MTTSNGTTGQAAFSPSPYHQGSRRRTGEQVNDEFVQSLLAVLGDCRLLWLPNLTDTTTSTDKSRNARTITWSESLALFDTGRARLGAGVQVAFNGTDEEGDTPDVSALSFGDGVNDEPFSVIALANPDVVNTAMAWAAKWTNAGSGREWTFEMNGSGSPSLLLRDASAAGVLGRRDATALTASAWQLVSATYNGTKASTGVRIYLNGARVDDTDVNSGSYIAMENGTALVTIGNNNGGASGAAQSFVNGELALVAVTAREISPDEIWEIKELCNGYFGLDL
ncbi:MAG: hypothetical protein O3B65_00135 [Chloroflexi bacterium]|nr:hypothetical protein [Chloroflexota bacterium]